MAVAISNNSSAFGTGGAVLTTSGGTIYVISTASNIYLLVYKSTDDGLTWSKVGSSIVSSTVHGTDYHFAAIDAAIDSNGYIHVVSETAYIADTRYLAYATLNTANDTWSSWEEAAVAGDANPSAACAIAIDSNNKPHVVFAKVVTSMGNNVPRVYYTNKTGASWSTIEAVGTSTTVGYYYPKITIRNSDIIETMCMRTIPPVYRTRTSGSWGTETAVTNGYALSMNPILATTGGTVYRYVSSQSSPYAMYEDDTAVGSIDVPFQYTAYAACLASSTRYLLYIDNSDKYVKYVSNSGSGWSDPVTLETVTATALCGEWAYNAEYQSEQINYAFTTSGSCFYNYLPLSNTPKPSVSDTSTASDTPTLGIGLEINSSESAGITDVPTLGMELGIFINPLLAKYRTSGVQIVGDQT